MYSHYLKPALRRIINAKLYSLISILSLAIGMTASILILAFVRFETSFDTMHPDSERIYRLNWGDPATGSTFATFFNPFSPLLAAGLPEIENFSRLAIKRQLFSVADVDQYAVLSMVDDGFFSLFSYPSVAGVADSAIRNIDGAVLTEAAALRLFGKVNATGEVFTVEGKYDFRVGAVVANNPANSHLGANIFVNIKNLPAIWHYPEDFLENKNSDQMYHYIKLAPGVDAATAAARVQTYIEQNIGPDSPFESILQPLRDIHFTPDLQNEMPMFDDMLGISKPLREKSDMAIFATVALLTLLIAALNFMNMQMVQFSRRTREVGVRRISGSSTQGLILRLLGETALMAFLALMIALPLCELLMPYLSSQLGMPVTSGLFMTTQNIILLALMAISLGILAGLYPAVMAAKLAPVRALRGELINGMSSGRFRSILIIIQFTISIGLIIGSYTVKNQVDYALSKSLGFQPEGVVTIELPNDEVRASYATLKTELLQYSGISAVAAGNTLPTRDLSDGWGMTRVGENADNHLSTRLVIVGDDYFAALGMQLKAGRVLSKNYADDKAFSGSRSSVILNETAARLAGWSKPEEAVGGQFYQTTVRDGQTQRTDFTVVGVVADAHYGAIRSEIDPLTFVLFDAPNVMIVKLAGNNPEAALAEIARVWQQHVPDYPMQLDFLEDSYSALYRGEERTFILFIALATLAILLACSGLYGLASYNTERRRKEIGVRKVIGGSVWSIVLLLTNDFSRLVLLANLIAWPVAWFAMNRWLENFAYRIDLTPMVFVGSGLIALCIAWVTVGGTAAKAASAKPVLALRYE